MTSKEFADKVAEHFAVQFGKQGLEVENTPGVPCWSVSLDRYALRAHRNEPTVYEVEKLVIFVVKKTRVNANHVRFSPNRGNVLVQLRPDNDEALANRPLWKRS